MTKAEMLDIIKLLSALESWSFFKQSKTSRPYLRAAKRFNGTSNRKGIGTMTKFKLAPIDPSDEIVESIRQSIANKDTTRTLYLNMLEEFQDVEAEPVAYERDSANNGWIPVNTADIGHYTKKGDLIRGLFTTPQAHRVAELEAKLAKVEADKARLIAELIHINKKLLSPNEVITALDQGRIDNLLAEIENKS